MVRDTPRDVRPKRTTTDKIFVVVVTHNRRQLLSRALRAIGCQSQTPSKIIVVDNASTDGTGEMLAAEGWLKRPEIEVIALTKNTGGAGGFVAGMERAIATGADWVWMMDDDAEPYPDSLEKLMRVAKDPDTVYGSLAIAGNHTSWLTNVIDPPLGEIGIAEGVPECAEVQSLPFLGFMIHRTLVQKIGFPDAGFFIAADDIEYCLRAQLAGARIIVAGQSRIEHPKSRPYKVRVLGHTLTCLALPPWKRYYDTRNRLLIARKYYGLRLLTQTVPGSFVRLVAALLKEPRKFAQLHAFLAGFIDGLLGIKGKRHVFWGIK
ncbi:MAG TPA: glycosyltransferase family 2 protein [Burkholderiaceae bacterium]|nr:glycosyltransferase family 2 protein [Burkholderiaceae bacterium]